MINMPSVGGGGISNMKRTPIGCLITWYSCVGTQQQSCWRRRWASELKCFEPPSPWYHEIFIVAVEQVYRALPAARPAPKATLRSHFSAEDVADAALTAYSDLEGQRETGNSWLTLDWSDAWDFPTRLGTLLFQPSLWLERVSAPLHTRESRRTRRRRREAYCRSWRKLFRGDSLPLSRENSINYLHWQMFTDPNMHEFVELAGFPQPNLLLFTMRAEAVVILAVLQRALIWAVSTTNHFGGNYFTP